MVLQIPDVDGQQLVLDLHHDDGQLGTVEGSSGEHRFKYSSFSISFSLAFCVLYVHQMYMSRENVYAYV